MIQYNKSVNQMAKFRLSSLSLSRLKGVHPDLVDVVKRAIENSRSIDFGVVCGLRSAEEQENHIKNGTSTTKNSRHLTGHAVDLYPISPATNRPILGDAGNDPKNWVYFVNVSNLMKSAAIELRHQITWGGDWKSFKDGYHFELSWYAYPHKVSD